MILFYTNRSSFQFHLWCSGTSSLSCRILIISLREKIMFYNMEFSVILGWSQDQIRFESPFWLKNLTYCTILTDLLFRNRISHLCAQIYSMIMSFIISLLYKRCGRNMEYGFNIERIIMSYIHSAQYLRKYT